MEFQQGRGASLPKPNFGDLTLRKFFVPMLAGAIAVGCSWTPRSSPTQVSHVNKGLQETSSCILAGLKKMEGPPITNSVNIVESGKVQEIIGTSDPYQLYVVRLTAESDDTKVEVFNVLNWSDFNVSKFENVLSPCVSGLKILRRARGVKSSRKGGAFTGE